METRISHAGYAAQHQVGLAGMCESPRQQGIIEKEVELLGNLVNRASSIEERLQALADRLLGDVPVNVATAGCPPLTNSPIAQLKSLTTDFHVIFDRTFVQIERLELL